MKLNKNRGNRISLIAESVGKVYYIVKDSNAWGELLSQQWGCGYAVTGHMHWYSTVMSTSNQPREK